MAEEVGFEPTVPCGTTVFKTAAFVHTATPPNRQLSIENCQLTIWRSVPSIVSEKGVESIIENRLSEEEQESLRFSASVLKKAMAELHMSE